MKTIWKYELKLQAITTLELPTGARVVHVAEQEDRPQLWALVDPSAPPEPRSFQTLATGEEFDDSKVEHVYLGSFLTHGGVFVGHVVELKF